MYPLGIRPSAWKFLKDPREYVKVFEKVRIERREKDRFTLRLQPTIRQMKTAAAILDRFRTQPGVLLADDVGLGKTMVAVLVACVFVGKGKKVRILAPNAVMKRRWRKEVVRHLYPVADIAKSLDGVGLRQASRNINRDIKKLHGGRIQVASHWDASKDGIHQCDLLIVDEAHRARSEGSIFAEELLMSRELIGRTLILTATPFSINLCDLMRMLRLVGASEEGEALKTTEEYADAIERLWEGDFGDPNTFGNELAKKARSAVMALKPLIIRHSVERLSKERHEFGDSRIWRIQTPKASMKTVEAIIRAVRMLKLGKQTGSWKYSRENDPRFHEGWQHMWEVAKKLSKKGSFHNHIPDAQAALTIHRKWIENFLKRSPAHEKIEACVDAVSEIVWNEGEKVLVFCDHHATAREVTLALAKELSKPNGRKRPTRQVWIDAWNMCFADKDLDGWHDNWLEQDELYDFKCYRHFVEWLSCGSITAQIASWFKHVPPDSKSLSSMLKRSPIRGEKRVKIMMSDAAADLYRRMVDRGSPSTRGVLAQGPDFLPGWGNDHQVMVMSTARYSEHTSANRSDNRGDSYFFKREPDTPMAIFNSPFGPEVFVATDKLSEGVDLHGCCRYLMHYELDPSPIRTVQRNGRIRRVSSWAAMKKKPILVAYPALRGTRDQRLVEIMCQRLVQFDLLLGGVNVPIDPETTDEKLSRQKKALNIAEGKLSRLRLDVVRR